MLNSQKTLLKGPILIRSVKNWITASSGKSTRILVALRYGYLWSLLAFVALLGLIWNLGGFGSCCVESAHGHGALSEAATPLRSWVHQASPHQVSHVGCPMACCQDKTFGLASDWTRLTAQLSRLPLFVNVSLSRPWHFSSPLLLLMLVIPALIHFQRNQSKRYLELRVLLN